MDSSNVTSTNNLRAILRVLINKISDFYGNKNITEEEIYNIALISRNRKEIPYYPLSIGYPWAYSIDIDYCKQILEKKSFLSQVFHQNMTERTFYVDPNVASKINISKILLERELLESLSLKLENKKFEYENRVLGSFFLDILEKKHNYLFTNLGSMCKKSGGDVDFRQMGFDTFNSLVNLAPVKNIGKRGYEEKILSELGKSILGHSNNLLLHNLRLASIKKAYRESSENVEGKLVLTNGIFVDKYCKDSADFIYEFRDSIILDKNHRMRVLFGENGKFYCEKTALLKRECLLLGFVESFSGEANLRAAGLIRVDSHDDTVPASVSIPEVLITKEPELANIIVGEKNGSETNVYG